MQSPQGTNKPELSVIVVFYNMRREAQRTLYSLSRAYQRGIDDLTYEVIAVDSGSQEPLDQKVVTGFGDEFRYAYFDTRTPTPCGALNYGAQIAKADLLTFCIDGARILSPGILHYSRLAASLDAGAWVYTLSLHIGERIQNTLAEEGYTREDEDRLLASVDWRRDGYLLFDISSIALSSNEGYFSRISESNCITMSRSMFERLGGFDEKFLSPGGGLANLDFFYRANELEDKLPIMLLGEATFHQFHGGVATNVAMKDHPYPAMKDEYKAIRGKRYQLPERRPLYFGAAHPRSLKLLGQPHQPLQA